MPRIASEIFEIVGYFMLTRVSAALAVLALMAGTATAQKVEDRSNRDNYRPSLDQPRKRAKRPYPRWKRDNLPARVTRPGRYIYDDYPEWAAEALEPKSDH